jgi:pimeloyl-ACP methyl ester carboxylesterase
MAASAVEEIVGTAHEVVSDGLKLFVWEKRRGGPPSTAPLRATLLVHGATYGGPTDYDVQTPARDASLMDYLAGLGHDVFTFDVRGYGRSEKPEDGASVTTEAAVRDIGAVIDFIREIRGAAQVNLLGWSWGGVTTSLFTSRNPDLVRRLVIYAGGASVGGGGNASPAAPPAESWVVSTRESIMARIEQDVAIADAQEAFIAAALQWDSRSPTSGRQLPGPDGQPLRAPPEQISTPTLIIYGARDAGYRPDQLTAFFSRLNTTDKALVIVPDAGHFLLIQKARERLFTAAAQWFGYES